MKGWLCLCVGLNACAFEETFALQRKAADEVAQIQGPPPTLFVGKANEIEGATCWYALSREQLEQGEAAIRGTEALSEAPLPDSELERWLSIDRKTGFGSARAMLIGGIGLVLVVNLWDLKRNGYVYDNSKVSLRDWTIAVPACFWGAIALASAYHGWELGTSAGEALRCMQNEEAEVEVLDGLFIPRPLYAWGMGLLRDRMIQWGSSQEEPIGEDARCTPLEGNEPGLRPLPCATSEGSS